MHGVLHVVVITGVRRDLMMQRKEELLRVCAACMDTFQFHVCLCVCVKMKVKGSVPHVA